jgi:hypothetical protein
MASRATLLFPRAKPVVDDDVDDHPSERCLASVGAVAVLGAMVEQRKRTSSLPPPPPADESGARPKVDKKSLGFIKIR